MSTTNGRDCYGQLFPDLSHLKLREPLEGRAFRALVTSSGVGKQGRKLELKEEAWARCRECPDYQACYDLSEAKLLMTHVLVNTMVANPWVGEAGEGRQKEMVTV